jgi:hypothetical protein
MNTYFTLKELQRNVSYHSNKHMLQHTKCVAVAQWIQAFSWELLGLCGKFPIVTGYTTVERTVCQQDRPSRTVQIALLTGTRHSGITVSWRVSHWNRYALILKSVLFELTKNCNRESKLRLECLYDPPPPTIPLILLQASKLWFACALCVWTVANMVQCTVKVNTRVYPKVSGLSR